ncbi:MAG TPA: hypothetical protein VF978_08590 [Gemmatimonadales bacterium]
MTEMRWLVPPVGVALLLAVGGGAALAGAWHMSFTTPTNVPAAESPRAMESAPADAAATPADPPAVADRNLFRADRRRPSRPYELLASTTADSPRRAPPTLKLVGVALGSTRAALLQGIPGTEGARVLAEGDTVAGMTLVRVHRDRAVLLVGTDTVTLTLPEERR